ncbi:MAG TPA: glutaminase A [Lacipirellulaceae bacterium]|jgi:glutaminase|nr:glutaminase A [Lacipirellulaceae bacterium]
MANNPSTGALDDLLGSLKSAVAPCRGTLQDLHAKFRDENSGKVADYIPELALADPNWFGISIVTADGQSFDVGDFKQLFSIQSVSKPFVFGMALDDHGRDAVLQKVGVEPTGEAFNAIVLDEKSNRPFNPLVNAGAIATADLLTGKDFSERIKRLLGTFSKFAGREVYIDNAIFMSERTTGHRNRAIAHLMRNFDMVGDRFEESLELYFQQCSILVNAHDLAVMGATLANAGTNPVTKQKAIDRQYVKDVLSVMLTCGMYDYAGEWAYRVGLPAKSGVGGGICAVVPGQAGIGIFSPLVDVRGNSVRGIKVCEELSTRFGLHVFESRFDGERFADQFQLRRK